MTLAVARRWNLLVLPLALVLLFTATARASDDSSSPQTLVLGYQYSFDNTGFGIDANEPDTANGTGTCNGSTIASTDWYRFRGTGRDVDIETFSSDVDTVLQVYRGSTDD